MGNIASATEGPFLLSPEIKILQKRTLVVLFLFIDLRREAESNLSLTKSIIGHHLRISDDNDLEHVMNTDSSLETCPFATFRPPPTFYDLIKLFF